MPATLPVEFFWEFNEGFEARRADRPLNDNPFLTAILKDAWDAGWRIADAAIKSGWRFGREH